MSKLSNSDSRTIRHAREAIDLIMSGALAKLSTEYGPNDEASRHIACDALVLHCREEMDSWTTTHENLVDEGASNAELTNDETALVE